MLTSSAGIRPPLRVSHVDDERVASVMAVNSSYFGGRGSVAYWGKIIRVITRAKAMSVADKIAVGVVGCCGFVFSALLLLYAASPWLDHKEIPVFGARALDTALFGVAGLIFVFVTIRLLQGRRWAWRTAFAVSILTLGLGVFVFYSALHPQNDFGRSESGFGIGISIILMTPGLISGALLALPSVRRRFGFGTATF
jgi:hypothetical protein